MEEEERNRIIGILNERLESHDINTKIAQNKLHEICNGMRKQIDDFEKSISNEVGELFNKEDNRLRNILSSLHENTSLDTFLKTIQKIKSELLVTESYDIIKNDLNDSKLDFTKMYKLEIERKLVPLNIIDFEKRKPTNLNISFTNYKEVSLSFTFFSDNEIKIFNSFNSLFKIMLYLREINTNNNSIKTFTKEFVPKELHQQIYFDEHLFSPNTTYYMRIIIGYSVDNLCSQWSDEVGFTTPLFKECIWKECPANVNEENKYSVNFNNPKIALKASGHEYSTIIGDSPLPLNKITSWKIKILETITVCGTHIGIAPFDINQNVKNNYEKYGWYFYCFFKSLRSGPPHNYNNKKYGLRNEENDYVKRGDSVGVTMDTIKGELSFAVNEVNLGVGFEGVPLDKPLVPCVLLGFIGDTVELIL